MKIDLWCSHYFSMLFSGSASIPEAVFPYLVILTPYFNLFQTLPLNATVSLPHILLSKEKIDFGVSLVGRIKEMNVKLTNFGKSSCCWFVEKGKDRGIKNV